MVAEVQHDFITRCAVDVSRVRLIYEVSFIAEMIGGTDDSLTKMYEEKRHWYPDALIITHEVPLDPRYMEQPAQQLKERLPRGAKCIIVAEQQYGDFATIKGVKVTGDTARLDVQCDAFRGDKAFRDLNQFCTSVEVRLAQQRFRAAHEVAQLVGMQPLVLSRLLSVITVKDRADKCDTVYAVGLALKFARRELMVPGYSRRLTVESKERGTQQKWQFVAITSHTCPPSKLQQARQSPTSNALFAYVSPLLQGTLTLRFT
eukprot:m.33804 g.33804  ORF g.33804 m.33804 type:complete len:260 (-) comp12593_c0_seq3:889-1668(-)